MAADNYKRTLKQTQFDEEEYNFGLHLPNVSFVLQTVEQLIQLASRAKKIHVPRISGISEAETMKGESDN